MKRRQFIHHSFKAISVLFTSSFLSACLKEGGEKTKKALQKYKIFSGHSFGSKDVKELVKEKCGIASLDSTGNMETFALGEFVHGFAQNPKDPNQIICFPKLEKKGYRFLVKEKRHEEFSSAEGNLFYGHGTFTTDGKYFFSIEASDRNSTEYRKEGEMVKRRADTLEIVSKHTTFGDDPHDAFMLDPDTLVVANGAKTNSNVAFIDINTMKLKRSIWLKDKNQTARHLLHDKKQDIIYVLLSRKDDIIELPLSLTYIDLKKPEDGFHYFSMPDSLETYPHSQHVSIAMNDKFIITTLMDQKAVIVWDRYKKSYVKSIPIAGPGGIHFFEKENKFLVGTIHGKGYEIDGISLERTEISSDFKLNGAHSLYVSQA